MINLRHLDRLRGHTIYLSSLTSNSVVIDAGAHKGEFSLQLIEKYACSCYLVEANPQLAVQLPSSVKGVINAALCDQDGIVKFSITENLEGSQVVSLSSTEMNKDAIVEIKSLSLGTLLKRFDLKEIDLLKLDIEGAEFQLISSLDSDVLSSISQITVEFHDFKPDFQNDNLYEKCRDHLETMGFICCPMSFRTNGDVLFLNTNHFSFSLIDQFILKYVARWILKLKQVVSRISNSYP
jgi:FkbM family methyltransferase